MKFRSAFAQLKSPPFNFTFKRGNAVELALLQERKTAFALFKSHDICYRNNTFISEDHIVADRGLTVVADYSVNLKKSP